MPVTASGHVLTSGTCLHASLLLAFLITRFSPRQIWVRGGSDGFGRGCLDANGVWRGHYWLEAAIADHEIVVLDITADQFGHPPVRVLDAGAARRCYSPGPQMMVDEAAQELADQLWPGGFTIVDGLVAAAALPRQPSHHPYF